MADLSTLVFCFTGTHSKPRAGLAADCTAAGIATSDGVRARTTHLIATTNEVAANTKKVQDAIKKSIPIVTEVFMEQCIEETAAVDHDPYLLVQPGSTNAAAMAGRAAKAKTKGSTKPVGTPAEAQDASSVLLAHKYEPDKKNAIDPTGWWMSEKLDGVRAYWSGSTFYSRNGNVFPAPAFFTKDLPKEPLDGELWGGRGQFAKALSIAKSGSGDPNRWKFVSYAVFDVPKLTDGGGAPAVYEARQAWMKANLAGLTYASAVPSRKCTGKAHIDQELKSVEKVGGEGLMLRQPKSAYAHGRSRTLLKVKSFHDEEGIVVGTTPGKGKNAGICGALLLKTPDGRGVTVGTGLTDAERRNPPKNGSIVTYKYFELSGSLNPRFPTYVCVRTDIDWADYCKAYVKPDAVKTAALKRRHSILFGPKMGRADSQASNASASSSAAAPSLGKGKRPATAATLLLSSDEDGDTEEDADDAADAAPTSARPAKRAKMSASKPVRIMPQPGPPSSAGPFDGAELKAEFEFENHQTLQIISGNLLRAEAACIVNSTNPDMHHHHGLCGAMAKAAGASLQAESDAYVAAHGQLQEGEICVTSAGSLPSEQVLHIVVPSFDKTKPVESFHRLVKSVAECLVTADSLHLQNIAIPAVGAGAAGFKAEVTSRAIVSAVERYFRANPDSPLGLVGVVTNDKNVLPHLEYEIAILPV